MSLPKEVKKLVERFQENRDVSSSIAYNETQTRREFIDLLVHEKSLIQRQIDATDKQIDQLVYGLYGLTDEEIRIVEEETKWVPNLRGPYVDIFPCNDMIVNIWSSNILRGHRNRVDTHRSSTYYVAELHNNHC